MLNQYNLCRSIVERFTKFIDGAQVAQHRQRGQSDPVRLDRRRLHEWRVSFYCYRLKQLLIFSGLISAIHSHRKIGKTTRCTSTSNRRVTCSSWNSPAIRIFCRSKPTSTRSRTFRCGISCGSAGRTTWPTVRHWPSPALNASTIWCWSEQTREPRSQTTTTRRPILPVPAPAVAVGTCTTTGEWEFLVPEEWVLSLCDNLVVMVLLQKVIRQIYKKGWSASMKIKSCVQDFLL